MPVVSGILKNVGDVLVVNPGDNGPGQPRHLSGICALTGIFNAVTVAIESTLIGQPQVQGAIGPGGASIPGSAPAPSSPGEWQSVLVGGGEGEVPSTGPFGPLTSNGQPGSGFSFRFGCSIFQQVRIRLLGIGSGQIQASIATSPVPPTPFSAPAVVSH